MNQYTTPEQTAKLIELGFEKPKMAAPALKWVDGEPTFEPQYTIGELIEMLPSALSPNNDDDCEFHLMLYDDSLYWHVRYTDGDSFCYPSQAIELIDALYDMIVLLKEEGVI